MRELAHVFNLSKSTVHKTVLEVIDTICMIGNRVSDPDTERENGVGGTCSYIYTIGKCHH